MTSTARRRRYFSARQSMAFGVLAASLAAACGLLLLASRPTTWTAEVNVVILPPAGLDPTDTASYYDALTSGQIAATFAEVLAGIRRAEVAGPTGEPAEGLPVVDVTIVPDTTVLTVRVTSDSPETATETATEVVLGGSRFAGAVDQPYRLVDIGEGRPLLRENGPISPSAAGAVLIVAALVGVAVQQGSQLGAIRHNEDGAAKRPASGDDLDHDQGVPAPTDDPLDGAKGKVPDAPRPRSEGPKGPDQDDRTARVHRLFGMQRDEHTAREE